MFQFISPGKILLGVGVLDRLVDELAAVGQRPLLVTGRSGYARPVQALLPSVPVWHPSGEVTLQMVEQGVQRLRQSGCDCLIAVGGGSVIDAAKAVAAMATNPGELLDYLEVIGNGRPLTEAPLPTIALPTTAGTGAEATMNAVIASPAHRRKVSLRHPAMMPRVALIDPRLSLGLPPAVIAATAMDALTQLIEPFISPKANPMTDALCRARIPQMLPALERALQVPEDLSARETLALGALSSGLALANAGLGAVHGLAGPLGGAFGVAHGQLCAHLLVPILRQNWQQLQAGAAQADGLQRFHQLAALLGGPEESVEAALDHLAQRVQRLPLVPLRLRADQRAELPQICRQAQNSSSMKGNPVPLSVDALVQAVESVIEEVE